jgi:hypothetical protein
MKSSSCSCLNREYFGNTPAGRGIAERMRFIGTGAIELDDPPVRLEVEAIYAATDIAR